MHFYGIDSSLCDFHITFYVLSYIFTRKKKKLILFDGNPWDNGTILLCLISSVCLLHPFLHECHILNDMYQYLYVFEKFKIKMLEDISIP